MATGDQADFQNRIIGTLPPWFGDVTTDPVIGGAIAGSASVWAQVYSLLAYIRPQRRISTATDGFLDLAALDFFGGALPRRPNEMDGPYRQRILAALFPERATRPGMVKALTVLTGTAPVIFEPWRPADAACAGYAYAGVAQAGSYLMPAQAFITVTLPAGNGGAGIAGAGSNYAGAGSPYMAAADQSALSGSITAQDVYDTVNAFKAEGTTMWVQIIN
jgi:hypothetical protein